MSAAHVVVPPMVSEESRRIATIAPAIATDEDLQKLYNWVDEIPLSRPKRNIARDFADGVLFAEIVNHYFPKIIEIHNYSAANSNVQKQYNWNTLNQKVLRKLGYNIHQTDVDDVIKASPGAVERVLMVLQEKITLAQNGVIKVGRPSVAGGRDDDVVASVQEKRQPAVKAHPSPSHAQRASANAHGGHSLVERYQSEVDTEMLVEKEQNIAELKEMVSIMSEKIKKLEQLVRIKDSKIEALTQKCTKHGLT